MLFINKLKILIMLISILPLYACSIVEGDEVLHMKSDSSYHPIYVRGNKQADTYIIWVHGGPGSSGLYYGDIDEVAALHKTYRVVYWDQLSSGGTVGDPDTDDFTLNEFAKHVDGVVNIIEKEYQPKNIFLLGHSWGGFVSAHYLVADGDASLSVERQDKFNGFINLNAVFDVQETLTNGVTFVTNFANQAISKNDDVKFWEKTIDWYEERNGIFRGKDVTTHYEYVDNAGGMVIQGERRDKIELELTFKMVFASPFEFYSYYDNQKAIRTHLQIENASLVRDDEPNIKTITIPTLIMAGKEDKIAFIESSRRWHNMLKEGKNPDDFPLIEYDNAAHAVFLDSKDKYIEDIHTFINQHKK